MGVHIVRMLMVGSWLVAGCGGVSAPRTPTSRPPAAVTASSQELYEAGRFQEVVNRASAAPTAATPREIWFAAHSYLGLGRQAEARSQFERLASTGDDAWRATGELGMAVVSADGAAIDAARAAAVPAHAFAQYELGAAHLARGADAEAAAAFDRSAAADPTLAHAYYYAGLAYERLKRADLMANRFETFLRLAPDAPQRPEVQAILRTIRGQ